MTRWGRARVALAALAVAAILFVFVLPTRAYLAQRRQVGAAAHDVDVLTDQNEKLAAEAARLRSGEEIERRARSLFNMVYPGEQVYRVMPAPDAPTTTTVPS
jgi:cell division protein FtsB